jgi:phosphoribosylformylglycinamidine (FGAM) synthase-like enzyme
MNKGSLALDVPILGGNVSMYNSTDGEDIIPAIVIVMIGLLNV